MKLTRLLLTTVCVLGMLTAFSQISLSSSDLRSIRIDAVSNSEIQSYYERAVNSGVTEEQMYLVMQQRGLPADELNKLRQRIESINSGAHRQATGPITASNTERTVNSDAVNIPMQAFQKDSLIFGSELFSASSNVFIPDLRIATPSNYVIGPDDELVINVYGYSEQTYNLTVNREGSIYIPNVGPLFVNGLSIEQASAKIKAKLAATIYRGISSGVTKVQITLGKIRSIRVTVIGEARKPGTFTISSLTTLFNVLYLCGGPSDMGSYRNIELIRGNQISRKIDLYGILVNGDFKDNVLLEEGDVIRIPYYNARITISGQVKREGKFEVQPGESFSRLLSFAGGFTDSAYKASVQISQLTDQERKITDLPAFSFESYQPKGSDFFSVGRVLNRFANRVSIAGAVQRPGDYELDANMNVKQLIEKAGGLREDAYMDRGIISRLNNDLSPASVSFSTRNVMQGNNPIQLKKDDAVNIASVSELKDQYKVDIEGEVHAPGNYGWRQNLSVKDLILLAGGFTDYANPATIEVSRRIKNANVSEKEFKQAEVIRMEVKDGSVLDETKDVILQPFDIVVIRALPGYVQQRSIYVAGQVMNPGRYILQTNTERISDLVNRFGGFKSAADSNFITLRRVAKLGLSAEDKRVLFERLLNMDSDSLNNNARLRSEIYRNYDLISIDVRKALADKSSSENIALEEGDYITVERSSTLIKVSGEIYYPTVIPYESGKSMRYYITRSGSFTDNARKKGAMVIYPDGRAKSISKFLFFNSYPSIMPRSEIFVPAKNKNNRTRLTTGEWIAISSIFATLGTLIITAFKK